MGNTTSTTKRTELTRSSENNRIQSTLGLSEYIIVEFFVSLPPEDINNLALVCKTWMRLTRQRSLWRSVCENKYGNEFVRTRDPLKTDWRFIALTGATTPKRRRSSGSEKMGRRNSPTNRFKELVRKSSLNSIITSKDRSRDSEEQSHSTGNLSASLSELHSSSTPVMPPVSTLTSTSNPPQTLSSSAGQVNNSPKRGIERFAVSTNQRKGKPVAISKNSPERPTKIITTLSSSPPSTSGSSRNSPATKTAKEAREKIERVLDIEDVILNLTDDEFNSFKDHTRKIASGSSDAVIIDFSRSNLSIFQGLEDANLLLLADELNLSYNQLTEIPQQIGKMIFLNVVNFSNNIIQVVPPDIAKICRLQELYLANNRLFWEPLPTELGDLDFLRVLDVSSNQLSEEFLVSIATLNSLTYLDISSNIFKTIPTYIFRLTQLETLNASNNKISTIYDGFSSLTSLVKLQLETNYLADLPESFTQLTSLTHLDIRKNFFQVLPDSVVTLTNLEELLISENNNLVYLPEFQYLPKLKLISFSMLPKVTFFPVTLGHLTNLTSFDFRMNPHMKKMPPEIGNMTSLKSLDLSENNWKRIPPTFELLTNLTILDFHKNALKFPPTSLCTLTKLKKLNFSSTNLKSFPDEIGNMIHLRVIKLSDNRIPSIPESIYGLSSLKSLKLNNNTIEQLSPKIGQLTNLEILEINNNKLVLLPPEVENLKKLRKLDLKENFLKYLPWELSKLQGSLKLLSIELNDIELPPEVSDGGTNSVLNWLKRNESKGREQQKAALGKIEKENMKKSNTPSSSSGSSSTTTTTKKRGATTTSTTPNPRDLLGEDDESTYSMMESEDLSKTTRALKGTGVNTAGKISGVVESSPQHRRMNYWTLRKDQANRFIEAADSIFESSQGADDTIGHSKGKMILSTSSPTISRNTINQTPKLSEIFVKRSPEPTTNTSTTTTGSTTTTATTGIGPAITTTSTTTTGSNTMGSATTTYFNLPTIVNTRSTPPSSPSSPYLKSPSLSPSSSSSPVSRIQSAQSSPNFRMLQRKTAQKNMSFNLNTANKKETLDEMSEYMAQGLPKKFQKRSVQVLSMYLGNLSQDVLEAKQKQFETEDNEPLLKRDAADKSSVSGSDTSSEASTPRIRRGVADKNIRYVPTTMMNKVKESEEHSIREFETKLLNEMFNFEDVSTTASYTEEVKRARPTRSPIHGNESRIVQAYATLRRQETTSPADKDFDAEAAHSDSDSESPRGGSSSSGRDVGDGRRVSISSAPQRVTANRRNRASIVVRLQPNQQQTPVTTAQQPYIRPQSIMISEDIMKMILEHDG
eukprot:TRINITY_DN1711_c1_g1_i1.p1 TRINITY_DN1711_c1_g1~~TRINITY_DN1711_c1_g1_i1.p1  ORF type:complete len:1317 (+),score=396.48 TRINITY_DN1711_c1_g1_i1:26-3976(+)